jgi:NAD(P)-dependent dehydrogenase (short-subunit alcohol dehydrogenase family)
MHGPLKRAGSTSLAKVINVCSVDAFRVNSADTYSYQASKAALLHLTRKLAARLIEDRICVSGIALGSFPSDMNTVARTQAEQVALGIPAKRTGCAEDVVGAVVYLASRAGDYVVGETILVDGGLGKAFAVSEEQALRRSKQQETV